jgi:PDZ domain-containing protein
VHRIKARSSENASDALASEPNDARRSLRRTQIIGRSILSLVVLVILAAVIASFVPVNEYVIAPGKSFDVASLIAVPKSAARAHRGGVYLTDVNVISGRAIDYVLYAFNHDVQFLPVGEVSGTLSAADYNEEGVIDMVIARQAATVVALRSLGYSVHVRSAGVAIYAVLPGSPSSGRLRVGEVITAINSKATPSLSALRNALATLKPGSIARVRVHMISSSAASTVAITTGAFSNTRNGAACVTNAHASTRTPCLGISAPPSGEQFVAISGAPFPVTIDADGIVGPSAGLAFTLGLMQKLDRADLTGGLRVAATGTMSISGTVGDVGGVAQKTVAVRNANAQVFFVPKPEVAVAKAHAGTQLKVIGVANIAEALRALEHLGGRISRGASGGA